MFRYTQGTNAIVLDNVACSSSDTRLVDCRRSSPFFINYDFSDKVALECTNESESLQCNRIEPNSWEMNMSGFIERSVYSSCHFTSGGGGGGFIYHSDPRPWWVMMREDCLTAVLNTCNGSLHTDLFPLLNKPTYFPRMLHLCTKFCNAAEPTTGIIFLNIRMVECVIQR